jgi:trk system potassium uptake protein TrkH
MHARAVLSAVGLLTAFAGLTMLLPAAVSAAYLEPVAALAIVESAGLTAGLGWLVYRRFGPITEISIRDGFAIVTMAWVAVAAAGCLPYLLTGSIPSFTGAFFEAMAGLTTTGATVVTDIDRLPRGVLLWRSQTQWMGGMGIIVLSVAILPVLGIGGMQLLSAEIPGLAPDRLRPRLRQTASLLWGVYVLLTIAEALLLWIGGMTLFEAVNHAFTTMATGGFSTEDASLGAFPSPFVQYVVATFCVLAGVNFTLHYSWMIGRWNAVARNRELRVYLVIVTIATAALSLIVYLPGDVSGVEASFRVGFFHVASIMTTTGYATVDYDGWSPAARILLLLLMLIGGCTGSTAGSVKVLRYMLVAKQARVAMRRLLHPQGVFVHKLDGKIVSEEAMSSVSGFLLLYLTAFAAGTLILALLGLDTATSVGATAATLGNVGPGFGLVGPSQNYAALPGAALWLLSFLMLLGRLELFTVLILFTRGYWRR